VVALIIFDDRAWSNSEFEDSEMVSAVAV